MDNLCWQGIVIMHCDYDEVTMPCQYAANVIIARPGSNSIRLVWVRAIRLDFEGLAGEGEETLRHSVGREQQ